MKGANIRPRSTAAKKKPTIPLSLKKILASSISPETTIQKSRPKLIFPDLSFVSDIQSPKAILRSFENFNLPSPHQYPASTKNSIVASRQTPVSPEMLSGFTWKSPTPVHRSPIPRSPLARSPTVSSIRRMEKSKLDEKVYLALKEKTQVYYTSTSPIPLTNESKQEILIEEDSLAMDRFGQTTFSSQVEFPRSASQTIIVPLKYDKVKENENKADSSYVMNQKKWKVKDNVLRKILSETNMSTIKTKGPISLGVKENKSTVKPVKVIRLKKSEPRMSRAGTMNNSKALLFERSESPKEKEVSMADQSSEKLYKSIRLKYLVDPNAEEEISQNIPSRLRSIICENISKDDIKTKSVSENSLLKGQKFTGRFTKIDNAFAKESSQRTKRDSERHNNIERISGRCAQKEKRVAALVEELRLANSLMLTETITLDRSRISKSSIKTRKNIGDIINLYPTFSRINN